MLKHINIKVIVLGIIILLFLLVVYRVFIHVVIDAKIVSIEVLALQKDDIDSIKGQTSTKDELGLSDSQVKEIIDNPSEFRYVVYKFSLKNTSNNTSIDYINIKPLFSKEMINNVVGYKKVDGVSPILIPPNGKYEHFPKSVLVKRNGKTDEELRAIAKKDAFIVSGITGDNVIDIGYNFKTVGYTE